MGVKNKEAESGEELAVRVLVQGHTRAPLALGRRGAAILAEASTRGFLVMPRGMSNQVETRLVLAWSEECRRHGRPFLCARHARRWAWIHFDTPARHRLTWEGWELLRKVLLGASVRATVMISQTGGGTWVRGEDAEIVCVMLLDILLEHDELTEW